MNVIGKTYRYRTIYQNEFKESKIVSERIIEAWGKKAHVIVLENGDEINDPQPHGLRD